MDDQYKYDPLIIRHDISMDKGVFFTDTELFQAKISLTLIKKASRTRYPIWQCNVTGDYIGGYYNDIHIISSEQQIHIYEMFKREAQVQGYLDTLDQLRVKATNPFCDHNSLAKHVWAYAYEKGSRVARLQLHREFF